MNSGALAAEAVNVSAPDYAALAGQVRNCASGMNNSNAGAMVQLRAMARLIGQLSRLAPGEQEALASRFPESEREEMKGFIWYLVNLAGIRVRSDQDFAADMQSPAIPGAEAVLFQSWVAQKPEAALAYWKTAAAATAPPEWTGSGIAPLFNALSQIDPRRALREAAALPDEELRQKAFENVKLGGLFGGEKATWPTDGGEVVRELAEAAPAIRQRMLEAVLEARAGQETPDQALAWLESVAFGPDASAWTDKALAAVWGKREPAAAADWLVSRTPADAAPEVIGDIVSRWTQLALRSEERSERPEPDIAACADWILAQGTGRATEQGMARLADAWITVGESGAALAWARAIQDPALRARAVESVTGQIQRRYPDTWQAMQAAQGGP